MAGKRLSTRRLAVLAVCMPILLVVAVIVAAMLPRFRTPAMLPTVQNAATHVADALATIGYSGPADGRLILYESEVAWDGTQVKDWVFFVPAGGTTLDQVKVALTATSRWLDCPPELSELSASVVARRIGIRSLGTVTRSSSSSQWSVLPNGSGQTDVFETTDGLIVTCRWIWLN